MQAEERSSRKSRHSQIIRKKGRELQVVRSVLKLFL
jgi:hypothetical protein